MTLSQQIFHDTSASFFAILTWRYGRQYIDALDKMESIQRLRHGTGLTRQELISICDETLNASPQPLKLSDPAEEEEEKEEAKLTPAEMLRHMLKCEWLEEPKRSDYQRVYYLDSRAELLLEALRRIAYPEQITFTDKLHLVCTRLMDPAAFTEHPLSDLEAISDNLRYGLQELRSMQQGMARLTQRQLKSDSLKENLQVLYDDFSENIGQKCYKSLIGLDIPIRVPLVKQSLSNIENNPMIISKIEVEFQKRRPELSDEEVALRVQKKLRELAAMIDSVEPQSEAVDRRAADFARRSFARFRYLQEVSSGRRSEVRELFEKVNEGFEGCRMANLPEQLDLPKLKIPSVGLLSGIDSLSVPRPSKKALGERTPLIDDYDFDDTDIALDEMSENINSSLTSLRANRFFHSLGVPKKGLNAKDFPTDGEEWLLELTGLLLHSETTESAFDLLTPRETFEEPERHHKDDYVIDDFTIKPKAK